MRRPAALSCLALFSVLAVAAPPARADQPAADSQPDPAAIKRRGDEAFDALRFQDALDAYSEAYQVRPDPALLYNQGRALQALGRYSDALTQLERFKAEASAELLARVPGLADLIADIRARTSTLSISCNVPGATVTYGGQVLGTLPLQKPLRLNAGRGQLEVSADGYLPFRKSIELPRGGTLVLEASLLQKARAGVLRVRSNTPRAFVNVDGKPVGNAPAELALEAGSHRIELGADGYESKTLSALIEPGRHRDLSITLDRGRPLTSKWWFWTAASAVVLGGTALTIALLTEKDPGTGDFQPGQVSAPLLRY